MPSIVPRREEGGKASRQRMAMPSHFVAFVLFCSRRNGNRRKRREQRTLQTASPRRAIGRTFTLPRWAILRHIVNHATYHRGQIAADLRAAGLTPPYTDFIHAVRQGFLE